MFEVFWNRDSFIPSSVSILEWECLTYICPNILFWKQITFFFHRSTNGEEFYPSRSQTQSLITSETADLEGEIWNFLNWWYLDEVLGLEFMLERVKSFEKVIKGWMHFVFGKDLNSGWPDNGLLWVELWFQKDILKSSPQYLWTWPYLEIESLLKYPMIHIHARRERFGNKQRHQEDAGKKAMLRQRQILELRNNKPRNMKDSSNHQKLEETRKKSFRS